MTEIAKCPTCGRTPSQRVGVKIRSTKDATGTYESALYDPCPGRIHDLADVAAGLLLDLWEIWDRKLAPKPTVAWLAPIFDDEVAPLFVEPKEPEPTVEELQAKIADLEEKLEELDLKYNDYIAEMEPDDDPERERYGR